MNTFNLTSGLSILILSTGLVSCSEDKKKTTDSFKAPPPVIRDAEGLQGLRDWSQRPDRRLDVQSSLDLSAGSPTRVEVTSQCQKADQNLVQTFSPDPRVPIKIFQILPRELLTVDFETEKVSCAFELILFNALGSRHVLNIHSSPIEEVESSPITLSRGPDTVSEVMATAASEIFVRYKNSGPASISAECTDVTFFSLPFEQVIALSHLDLLHPQIKENRAPDVIDRFSRQTCRLLLHQNGQLNQLSPRFVVQLPRAPVSASFTPLPADIPTLMALYRGRALPIGHLVLNNASLSPRRLRIPRAGQPSLLEIYAVDGRFGRKLQLLHNYPRNWMLGIPLPGSGVSIQENPDYWLITLDPNAQATLLVQLTPPGEQYCRHAGELTTSPDIWVSGEVQWLEVTESDEVLESTKFPIPRLIYGPTKEGFRFGRAPERPCDW